MAGSAILPYSYFAAHVSAKAIAPGTACTYRIFRLAVAAPKIPAMITQPRKNSLIA